MQTILHLSKDQWVAFSTAIETWLEENKASGEPLELCHQLVERLLGYQWEVDFYDALVRSYEQAKPRPMFVFEVKRASDLRLNTLHFFPKENKDNVAKGPDEDAENAKAEEA